MPTNDSPIVNYTAGSVIRLKSPANQGFAIDGVATDPTGVNIKYRDPFGVIVTKTYGSDPEVKKSGVGQYYMDIVIDKSGEWYFRFEGTAAPQVAAESSFWVEPSKF